jgi:predicted dehydrogenase
MSETTRRSFLISSAAAPLLGANERINVAVVGFHGQGMTHIRNYLRIPNVRVAALCDVDERLFPSVVGEVEKAGGYKPITEVDMRKLLDRKDIDAISIATPDYWHALQTIWSCQAGKDVYIEKPLSFTLLEGRRMVEAARKYKRIVQAGLNTRSIPIYRGGIQFLHDEKFGKVYRAKVDIARPRANIGRVQDRRFRRAYIGIFILDLRPTGRLQRTASTTAGTTSRTRDRPMWVISAPTASISRVGV